MSTETTRSLRRLSYVRIGECVDTLTGLVTYPHSDRVRGYVTVRWMKAHGYLPETYDRPACVGDQDW
jgi:hypothetical protein